MYNNPRKTKRLSGYEYKKKKAKKEDEKKFLTGSLEKYLKSPTSFTSSFNNNAVSEVCDASANILEDETLEHVEDLSADVPSCSGVHLQQTNKARLSSPDITIASNPDTTEANNFNLTNTDDNSDIENNACDSENAERVPLCDDPALWPFPILTRDRDYLVKKNPVQLIEENFPFPIDDNGRRFTSHQYYRHLANGERIPREWLVYSKSLNSVYCFSCKLFLSSSSRSISLSSKYGYSDWKHLSKTLSSHEISNLHVMNCNSWKILQKSFNSNLTIDASHQKIFESVKEHWKNILKRIISIILFLAGQNMAFRGSSENLYVHNNGNFLKTVELLAVYDPVMKEHLNNVQRISDSKRKIHYLGPQIQNELIHILSDTIKKQIIFDIINSKYFSLILDCTPDQNKVAQLTLILRYVKLNPLLVKESFIEYCPVTDTTGQGLADFGLSQIRNLGLDIQNLRGQGYDNGANMRGKNIGVQRQIHDINPRAMFVPCAAHSLNLVLNDAVKATFETLGFFSLVQAIFIFFSASTKRWSALKGKIKLLTLKPLSDTRWESRIEAIKPLKYQIGDIYDVLVEIANDSSYDPPVRHEADCLAKKIKRFDFLVCLVLWYEVLNHINAVSKILQNPNFNIIECSKSLESVHNHFYSCRNDNYFQQILVDAAELAHELEVEAKFALEGRARPRKRTRQFLYEGKDEPICDPEQKFKVEIFFKVMDIIIQSLEERFDLLKVHAGYFSFLYDLSLLPNHSKEELLKFCMDLHSYLSDGESTDINGLELKDELLSLNVLVEANKDNINSPLKTLQYIKTNNLDGALPNLVIALRILLTIPVSVASFWGKKFFEIKNHKKLPAI